MYNICKKNLFSLEYKKIKVGVKCKRKKRKKHTKYKQKYKRKLL